MKNFNKRTIYIALFAILYICVGLVSTIHAVSFFALANVMGLAVVLALAFEIGQAAVLFSILTDIRKRKQFMPWLLMSVLTIVQIMGNIYSSYKYLISNSEDNLRYFKEPIFTWVESMPDQQANVMLCYVIGAILPIVSLLMTAMLTSYLGNDPEANKQNKPDSIEETETSKENIVSEVIEDSQNNSIEEDNSNNINDDKVTQNEQESPQEQILNTHPINL